MSRLFKNKQNLLIILCWAVYTVSYLGKYSYTSNAVAIAAHYGANKSQTGLITTMFFIAYGCGQVINGLFCKRYNAKYFVFGALAVSLVINLVLFLGVPFFIFKYLWLINGAAQSILWPTLISTLSKNLDEAKLKTAILAMSTTTALGTALSYATSALFVTVLSYKYSFLLATVLLAVIATVWIASYSGAVSGCTDNLALHAENDTAATDAVATQPAVSSEKNRLLVTLVFLAIFAVICNLIKDGVNTWVPFILKENFGMTDGQSIILNIALAIIGMFGSFSAVALNKKIKDYTLLSSVFFVLIAVCVGVVLVAFDSPLWLLILLVFSVISLLTHSVNNIITSMAPLNMRGTFRSGMLAGLLNGACYVGSAISAYGLGVVTDSFGWTPVFWLFIGCSLFAAVAGVVVFFINGKKNSEKSMNK